MRHLIELYGNGHKSGLLGYSLGGNFALRVAQQIPQLETLSVCPAIEPGNTMVRIDQNTLYRRYFVHKWRATWVQKQAAFPELYDFTDALQLSTVGSLTDYFIKYHSEFVCTQDYFDAYDLRGSRLVGTQAHVLAARDDPIIAYQQWSDLPSSISVELTDKGGHGAYMRNWQLESWADEYATNFFQRGLLQ